MRILKINGQEYNWKVGRSHVLIRSEGRKVSAPTIAEVLGLSPSDVERGKWKGWLHVTPADVIGYLVKITDSTPSETPSQAPRTNTPTEQ